MHDKFVFSTILSRVMLKTRIAPRVIHPFSQMWDKSQFFEKK
jgi:hypothetical protein